MSTSAAGGLIVLLILLYMILIGLAVVEIIAWCKLFRKAGIHPGKFFIPVYGQYLAYKMADCAKLYFVQLGISAVYSVVGIILSFNINTTSRVLTSSGRYRYVSSTNEGALTAYVIVMVIFIIAILVISIIYNIRLGRVFGKSGGFLVGMVLLTPIFQCILGFGDAEYQGVKGDYVPGGQGQGYEPDWRQTDAEKTYTEQGSFPLRPAPAENEPEEEKTGEQEEADASAPAEHMEGETWTCPACGNVNRSTARFCPTCGYQR
jgi:hypothetical protein